MKVVCPLAVVAFNLHCFGSDLRPLKWSFCTLYSFCELTMTAMFNIKAIVAFCMNKYVYVCVYFHNDFWIICIKKIH